MNCHSMKRLSNTSCDVFLLLFWIVVVLNALSLFLFGFFPLNTNKGDFAVKQDIPFEILNVSLDQNNNNLYRKHVGRFVFVLIDAFRWDFLDSSENMPYVHKVQQLKLATFLTARCHPPTATMPRIKALMTGSVPNYIDVVLNLGSEQLKEDNLIHQATENGLKVVFYGDEVWLNLFPDRFARKEGTTSFFVSDYTEVDQNVTRHIPAEMQKNDWDILILHYLGLDHIGHLAGPSSPLIPTKLSEMDAVIKTVHENLLQWEIEHPDRPFYFVVLGDHGMHDSGSHGGATQGEVLTSIILMTNVPLDTSVFETRSEVLQIDVAPTLAVLLGLPIPKQNLGRLIPLALRSLSQEQYLFALFYNAQVVSDQFVRAKADGHSDECYRMFKEAQGLHLSWMKEKSDVLAHKIESLYIHATQEMSSEIVKTLVTYDVTALSLGCIMMLQVLVCSFCVWPRENAELLRNMSPKIFGACIVALFITILCQFFKVSCQSFSLHLGSSSALLAFAILLIGLQVLTLLQFHLCIQRVQRSYLSVASLFLRIGCILHTVSLSASSLIEEEHQTWYFMWSTLIILIPISQSCVKTSTSLKLKVLGSLVCHRFLRKLNQTGDKWAFLPDTSDWLESPEQQELLVFVTIASLFGVWLSLRYLKCMQGSIGNMLHVSALVLVFLFRSAVQDVYFPFPSHSSRGVIEAKIFWITSGLIFLTTLKEFKNFSYQQALRSVVSAWILITTLLLRPCNIILIPSLIFLSHFIAMVFQSPIDRTIAHSWLGATFYFYQGNSNSLSSIDVAAGYIGAENQNMLFSSFLVLVHTYSFPVLAVLLLWLQSFPGPNNYSWNKTMILTCKYYFSLRLLPLAFYCIIIGIQRHHLFIWTVFAPKLLYEVANTLLLFILLGLCCVSLLFFHS